MSLLQCQTLFLLCRPFFYFLPYEWTVLDQDDTTRGMSQAQYAYEAFLGTRIYRCQ